MNMLYFFVLFVAIALISFILTKGLKTLGYQITAEGLWDIMGIVMPYDFVTSLLRIIINIFRIIFRKPLILPPPKDKWWKLKA